MTTTPSPPAATAPGGAPPGAAPPPARPRLLLLASCLGLFMSFIEVTAAISTLRAMQVDLGVAPADLSWVSSTYTLVVAAGVLSGGAFGERYGRRRVFLLGVAALAAGSLVVAVSDGFAQVLAGRALSGVGGALVLPTSLALITTSFTDPRERGRKISVWVSVSGFGLALGPLIGGALLDASGWHAVYLVNAVLAVATVAVTLYAVPESRVPGRPLDWPGQVLAVAGLGCLVTGVAVGGRAGYGDPRVVAALVAAVAALTALAVVEARVPVPMLNVRMMRSAPYTAALVVAAAGLFAFVGVTFLEVQFLQRVQGADALDTGVRLLAAMAAFVLSTALASRLAGRLGAARLLVAGCALTGVAGLVLLLQRPDSPYGVTAAGLVLAGLGSGLVVAPSTTAALAVVPPPAAPAASSAVTAFRQVGSVLATAALGAVLSLRFLDALPAELDAAQVPSAVADVVLERAGSGSDGAGSAPAAVHTAVGRAFTDGVHAGMLVISAVSFAAAVLAALFLLRRRPATA
ncbi:MFS transporter [Streptomyces werraensis]|uniref:MFS transporter n=1 Tax=Streptomyces werraensis TaxID=68284 RepID=A0ABV3JNN5_9ACTN